MAHPIIKRRMNQEFKIQLLIGNDGEDDLYEAEKIMHGYSVEDTRVIIDYQGDQYQSGTQIYMDGDEPGALTLCGGTLIEVAWIGSTVVRGVRHYQERYSPANPTGKVGLVVIYL